MCREDGGFMSCGYDEEICGMEEGGINNASSIWAHLPHMWHI